MKDLIKIKRLCYIAYLSVGVFCFTGCSNNSAAKISTTNQVNAVLNEQMAAEELQQSIGESDSNEETNVSESEDESNGSNQSGVDNTESVASEINVTSRQETTTQGERASFDTDTDTDTDTDVDLTQMGSDMVYATVYQMMVTPKEYEGKTVKVSGRYYATWYDATSKYYHYVVIQDAMACCAQGMEFVWDDGQHIYPDEYPEDNAAIEVTGTFETYKEDGDENLYCRLENAKIETSSLESKDTK